MKFDVFDRTDSKSREMKDKLEHILIDEYGWEIDHKNPRFVICIGGDGTILRTVHHFENHLDKILFVGIHTGTLGFFTDYTRDELDRLIQDLISQDYTVDSYPLLQVKVNDQSEILYALNEVRIGNFAQTCRYDIYIDGEFFETTNGCGVCISSQIGATGANRSLMGAVVDPGLQVMQLTEIMPVSHKNHHSLKSPYIMTSGRIIDIVDHANNESLISYDHLEKLLPASENQIQIRMSSQLVHFARFRPYSYLKRLKNLY
jgi:NAD+ kinase